MDGSATNDTMTWMPSLSPTSAITTINEGRGGHFPEWYDDNYHDFPQSYYDNLLIFTKAQQTIIFCAGSPGAFLSILGSSLIVFAILQKKKPLQGSTQHRLLLGLCTMDILYSLGFLLVFWPWSIPEYADFQIVGAHGNQQTCNFNAFVFNMASGIQLYSASLSLYFVLMVKYQLSIDLITKRVEPVMHILAWGFVGATYIAGVCMKVFHPVQTNPGMCWFQKWPPNCDLVPEVECSQPGNARIWAIFLLFAYLLSLIGICVSMFLLYKTVRTKEMQIQQYDFARHLESEAIEGQQQQQSRWSSLMSSMSSIWQRDGSSGQQNQQQPQQGSSVRRRSGNSSQQEQDIPRRNTVLSKQTAQKGIMYVCAYLATFVPFLTLVVVAGVMEHTASNQVPFFIMNIFFNAFTPLQGFLHAIIFFREKRHLFEDLDGPLHFAWPFVQCMTCCFVATPTLQPTSISRTSRRQSLSSHTSLRHLQQQQRTPPRSLQQPQQPPASHCDLHEDLSAFLSIELTAPASA